MTRQDLQQPFQAVDHHVALLQPVAGIDAHDERAGVDRIGTQQCVRDSHGDAVVASAYCRFRVVDAVPRPAQSSDGCGSPRDRAWTPLTRPSCSLSHVRCRSVRADRHRCRSRALQHEDHILVATLPLAPRHKTAAAPDTDASPTRRLLPGRRARSSAWPRVSWKCTASALIGISSATARSIARAAFGVPAPIVSPSEISWHPSCRASPIRAPRRRAAVALIGAAEHGRYVAANADAIGTRLGASTGSKAPWIRRSMRDVAPAEASLAAPKTATWRTPTARARSSPAVRHEDR